jgi:hypothetical protein
MMTVLRFLLVAALLLNGPLPATAVGHPVSGTTHAHDDATEFVAAKHQHCASQPDQVAPPDEHGGPREPSTRSHRCGGAACHCGCAGPLFAALPTPESSVPVYVPVRLASSNAVRPPPVRTAPPFRPPAA